MGLLCAPATQQFPRILFTTHKGVSERLGRRGGDAAMLRERERERVFDIYSPVKLGSNCHHGCAENIEMDV